MTTAWGSDVPISMPEPPKESPLISMGGFTYTASGLFHDLTQTDVDRLLQSGYSPVAHPEAS